MYSRWIVAFSLIFPPAFAAQTISLTAGDIEEALVEEGNVQSGVSAVLERSLSEALRDAGVVFQEGQLLTEQTLENVPLSTGCTSRATLERLSLSAEIQETTGLSFTFENLAEPLNLSVRLSVGIQGDGKVDQDYGARILGDCSYYATDDFTVDVDGKLDLNLDVEMALNADQIEGSGIQLAPVFSVSGSVGEYRIDADVDDTLLASLLEDRIDDEVNDLFSEANVQQMVSDLESSLNNQVAQAIDQGELLFTVDAADDEALLSLYSTLSQQLSFPMTAEYFSENAIDLLFAALGDEEAEARLTSLAACDASQVFYADMGYAPLYEKTAEGICEASDLRADGTVDLYLDVQCEASVDYRSTSIADFCAETLDTEQFGNGEKLLGQTPHWTLNPGTRFDIGLNSIASNLQPFMTRRVYRSVDTEVGQCHLEMRIYKSRIDEQNLRPMLVLHGGSWRHRGAGYPAQESQISHYTDAGFVVFAPFYRLADDKEANPACHNASAQDIVSDTEFALDWIRENAADFGASDDKVIVEGQSAGAYLAAALAVDQADKVDRALLFYPPTDFANYLEQYQADPEGFEDAGKNAIEAFTGKPIDELSASDPDVIAYSLPQRVQNRVGDVPPIFMIHGVSDTVVPSTQAVRLCNALSGNAESGDAINDGGIPEDGEYRKLYDCDDQGSQLHLIAEGDHALDVCAFNTVCPAGGLESQKETAESMLAAFDWLVDETVVRATSAESNSEITGGGGALFAFSFLPLIALRKKRKR